MKKFTCVEDIGYLKEALREALEVKRDRFAYKHLGENKTLLMIFFNSSLRTRLSTQKAAMNLGMNVMVLDVNQGAWKLETERGVVMDGDKAEHLLEAIPVMVTLWVGACRNMVRNASSVRMKRLKQRISTRI